MKLIALPTGPIETNAWLLINEADNKAILFDAPPQSYNFIMDKVREENCELSALVITHGHWDHMLDTHLFEADGVPVFAHEDTVPFIENPESMSTYAMPGLTWTGSSVSNLVDDGDSIEAGGVELRIFSAPGHCPGSIVISIEKMKTVIVGDVIFRGSIGRTDLPGGSFELLSENIVNKLYTMPDDFTLCPGHGPVTTVRFEKANNPFVKVEV